MSLAIVTATTDLPRAKDCLRSWTLQARGPVTYYVVGQQPGTVKTETWHDLIEIDLSSGPHRILIYMVGEILGVVPAFAIGVQKALEDGHEVIACLHDDLLIEDPGWDTWVTTLFHDQPQIGLVGFGGGVGLGDSAIYAAPYNPMQLARQGFVSNMRDAESHGARSLQPVQVACLDGFSQVGRREYWQGRSATWVKESPLADLQPNLFATMQRWGIIHHCYDAALGCFAKRLNWQVWMLPIACHHFGGRTAVGDANYTAWANARAEAQGVPDMAGDQLFWTQAHQIVYNQFKDVLPVRVP